MKVLVIDPGSESSGVVFMRGREILSVHDAVANRAVMYLPEIDAADKIVCEWVAAMGMAVGREVFDTCRWVGVFEAVAHAANKPFQLVYRRDVKLHLCGDSRAKDKNIRQAILDLYPGTGGGKIPQIGTKAKPGPLYEVTSHSWAAIGLGLAVQESERLTKVQTVSLHAM